MTRKDYTLLASAIGKLSAPLDRKVMEKVLIPILKADNPNFDTQKFVDSILDGVVKVSGWEGSKDDTSGND